jgi:hypothetical protein
MYFNDLKKDIDAFKLYNNIKSKFQGNYECYFAMMWLPS